MTPLEEALHRALDGAKAEEVKSVRAERGTKTRLSRSELAFLRVDAVLRSVRREGLDIVWAEEVRS